MIATTGYAQVVRDDVRKPITTGSWDKAWAAHDLPMPKYEFQKPLHGSGSALYVGPSR